MSEVTPFNYRYFVDHATSVGGRILDYGCGLGEIVAIGRRRGLDLWGADTYSGHYASLRDAIAEGARGFVRQIRDSRADFPDGHFDLVMSNQVLEHVTDPEAVIADMARLAKPGGTMIVAFPVASTWYEGHVGLYFVHRMPRGRFRHAVFVAAHHVRLGLNRKGMSATDWAKSSQGILDEVCFYYPRARMVSALRRIGAVEDIAVHYMRSRLGSIVRLIPDGILRFIYHKRAGEIFRIVKGQ